MNTTTPNGCYSRIFIDRDHVKVAQAAARPWIVENDGVRYRCKQITGICNADTVFDITRIPCLFIETVNSFVMYDVEILP